MYKAEQLAIGTCGYNRSRGMYITVYTPQEYLEFLLLGSFAARPVVRFVGAGASKS